MASSLFPQKASRFVSGRLRALEAAETPKIKRRWIAVSVVTVLLQLILINNYYRRDVPLMFGEVYPWILSFPECVVVVLFTFKIPVGSKQIWRLFLIPYAIYIAVFTWEVAEAYILLSPTGFAYKLTAAIWASPKALISTLSSTTAETIPSGAAITVHTSVDGAELQVIVGRCSMVVFDVVSDIRPPKLQRLLWELALRTGTIGFVIQGNPQENKVEPFLHGVSGCVSADESSDRWPGTILLSGKARVLEARATPEVIDMLADFAGGLFETGHDPSLPQDFFIRSDTNVVLETISHERLATIRADAMSPLLRDLEYEGCLARRASDTSLGR